jgi:hypothetical protein
MSPQAVAAVASEDTWACPLCTGDIENVDEARLEARQRSEAAAAAYLAASAAAAKPVAKLMPTWESDDEDELDGDDDVDDEEDYESGDDDVPKKKRAAPAFPRPRGRPPKKDKPKAAMWLLLRPNIFSANGKKTVSSELAWALYRLINNLKCTWSKVLAWPFMISFKPLRMFNTNCTLHYWINRGAIIMRCVIDFICGIAG